MSFIKWVGGKSKLLAYIIPKITSKKFQLYLESFLGSGAVLISLLEQNQDIICRANDINKELITTFEIIKTNPMELIYGLQQLKECISEEMYYKFRDEYNELIQSKDEIIAFDILEHYELIERIHNEPTAMIII